MVNAVTELLHVSVNCVVINRTQNKPVRYIEVVKGKLQLQKCTAIHSQWKAAVTVTRSTGVLYSTAQHSTAQHSTAQHNTTQHSTVQHNTKQHSTAQHNTTQHNTAQHNTTQHSTARHNTTQHFLSVGECKPNFLCTPVNRYEHILTTIIHNHILLKPAVHMNAITPLCWFRHVLYCYADTLNFSVLTYLTFVFYIPDDSHTLGRNM